MCMQRNLQLMYRNSNLRTSVCTAYPVPVSTQPGSYDLFAEHLVSATLLGTDTSAECTCGIMGEMKKTSLLCLVPPNEKAGKGNVSTFQPLNVSFSKMK